MLGSALTLFKYMMYVALGLGAYGVLTGQQQQQQQQAGIAANLMGGLGSLAGSAGGHQGVMDAVWGFAGEMSEAWKQGQRGTGARRGAAYKSSSSSNSPYKKRSSSSTSSSPRRTAKGGRELGPFESLAAMVQDWVLESVDKAVNTEDGQQQQQGAGRKGGSGSSGSNKKSKGTRR